jgi:hypothetical protein
VFSHIQNPDFLIKGHIHRRGIIPGERIVRSRGKREKNMIEVYYMHTCKGHNETHLKM